MIFIQMLWQRVKEREMENKKEKKKGGKEKKNKRQKKNTSYKRYCCRKTIEYDI